MPIARIVDWTQAMQWLAMALESVAAAVITVGAVASVAVMLLQRSLRPARLTFAHALLYALDFTIAADAIKLAAGPDMRSAMVVAIVVAVRVALTALLLWEVQHDEAERLEPEA